MSSNAYLLLGFKCGFQSKTGFSIFFEAKNLADEHYPAAVNPIPDARTAEGLVEIFRPGDGRTFYGGTSWKFFRGQRWQENVLPSAQGVAEQLGDPERMPPYAFICRRYWLMFRSAMRARVG